MITDTGNHQTWVEQYWDAYEPRSVFTPGGFAGMGFGTCGVLGLKLAAPDRPAVCVTSDGSFSMFPHAVATAVEYDIPAVWVLLNNYTIGVIRDLQRFYMDNREIGTSFRKQSTGELWNPDFAKMAEAMGALAYSIDKPGDVAAGVRGRAGVRPPRGARRAREPRHGGAADRHLAVPADRAGGAHLRTAAGAHLSTFPFTAIVEQQRLKRALLLNAVNPAVGGLLVSGPSGTAKSTAVRALAELLPEIEVVAGCAFVCDPAAPACDDCRARADAGEALPARRRRRRVVTLPLNATEDRVAGTIDMARALTEGIKALEPGLLAEANRGILYVDEINLLDDHLGDILLDAAAMGENVVEREGMSITHPARFLLVGTMNPEEGDLRPQLADRIGLHVEVEPLRDPELRGEVIRRREAFTTDPEALAGRFASYQEELRARVDGAVARLAGVQVPDAAVSGDRVAGDAPRRRQPSRRRDGARVREGDRGARRARRGRGGRRARGGGRWRSGTGAPAIRSGRRRASTSTSSSGPWRRRSRGRCREKPQERRRGPERGRRPADG